jgi:alditol oxidase
VYEGLPLAAVVEHFEELMSAAHGVCVFTDWRTDDVTEVWVQERADAPAADVVHRPWFTAREATTTLHPVRGHAANGVTTQGGEVGPWHERLPHFRPDSPPSSAGDELQSEYLLDRADAPAALRALDAVRDGIGPALQVCEVRTLAADRLWLSPAYGRATVGLHFTWTDDDEAVLAAVAVVERALAPFAPRPHWGKIFTEPADRVRERYPRLADFGALARKADPRGTFRNAFLDRYVLGV